MYQPYVIKYLLGHFVHIISINNACRMHMTLSSRKANSMFMILMYCIIEIYTDFMYSYRKPAIKHPNKISSSK